MNSIRKSRSESKLHTTSRMQKFSTISEGNPIKEYLVPLPATFTIPKGDVNKVEEYLTLKKEFT